MDIAESNLGIFNIQNKMIVLLLHVSSVASVVLAFLQPHGLRPTRLFCPWDSPGKSTGVGCHALF